MFLKGQHVAIRATEPSDADTLYDWENNIQVWSVSNSQTPISKFTIEEFVNASHQDIYTNKQLRLMITSISKNKSIGVIDLFDFDPQHNRCGLGVFITEEERGKGLAQESIELIKAYVFKILNLKQLYVHVNASNTKSQILFEKTGFEKNGIKKFWHKTAINTYEDVWFMQCYNPLA